VAFLGACDWFASNPNPELPIVDYLQDALLDQVANVGDFARMLVLNKWVGTADANGPRAAS
jgi:hypothetical protein